MTIKMRKTLKAGSESANGKHQIIQCRIDWIKKRQELAQWLEEIALKLKETGELSRTFSVRNGVTANQFTMAVTNFVDVVSLASSAIGVTTFVYDECGNEVGLTSNGFVICFCFSTPNSLHAIIHHHGNSGSCGYLVLTTPLLELTRPALLTRDMVERIIAHGIRAAHTSSLFAADMEATNNRFSERTNVET